MSGTDPKAITTTTAEATQGGEAGDGSPPDSGEPEEDSETKGYSGWPHVIGNMVRKSKLTNNALYLWMALYYHLIHGVKASIPEECLSYLKFAAYNIYNIAHGIDPRNPITRNSGESLEDYTDRLFQHYDETPPLGSAEHVARALLLKRPGWDAFRSYASDRQNERVASSHNAEFLKPGWESPFLKRLRDSEKDERTIRRQRSRGDKLLGWTVRTKHHP